MTKIVTLKQCFEKHHECYCGTSEDLETIDFGCVTCGYAGIGGDTTPKGVVKLMSQRMEVPDE